MTDSAGSKVEPTVKYLPFGEARNTQQEIDNYSTDKLFTGQRLDGTGLYYYGARYYDASIGRFISPDTVIQSPANPQTLNRYSYCLNNPLKYFDPSGHVVTIGGLDVRAADAMLNCPFLPLESFSLLANVVSSTEFQAYDKIRKADNTITNALENDPMDIEIIALNLGATPIYDNQNNKVGYSANAAITKYINSTVTVIAINTNPMIDQNVDTYVKNMSHELIHAYQDTKDPFQKVENSRFEENIADIYSKKICDKAGISNNFVPPTYWWTNHLEIPYFYSFPMPVTQNGGTILDAFAVYEMLSSIH